MADPNDPLFDLAVQAGFFPQTNPEEPYGYESEYDPGQAVPPALTTDVAGGGLTAPDLQMSSPPEGVVQPGRQGYSVAQSERGFSDQKFGQVSAHDKGLQGEYAAARRSAEGSGAVEQQEASAAAGTQAIVDDEGNTILGGTGEKGATEALTAAAVEKMTASGQQALLLKGIEDGFAEDEAKANMQANAMSTQAKMDYVASLADFRATKINANALYDNMDGGTRFGTIVTAFVHDFLGSRGIKTSAMDTLNKAVDRNIEAQVHNLKTKGTVAEGFKDLWYMQRSQSASDVEARTRVRGFLLEGAKQHVISNMAQYEAGLATAQGQAAIAAIDKELSKTMIDINRHIDSNTLQLRQQALTLHGQKLQAAASAASTKVARDELAFKKDQYEKGLKAGSVDPSNDANYIINPETNKGELIFKEKGVTDKERAEVRANVIGVAEVNKAMGELRELDRKLKPSLDPIQGTRLEGEEARNYEAIRLRLAHAMVKANGERATDKDVNQYLKGIPRATDFTKGGVKKILAYTHGAALDGTREYIRQYARDVPVELQPSGALNAPFLGASTDAKSVASGRDEETTFDQRQRATALGQLAGPEAMKAEGWADVSAGTKDAFLKFKKLYPEHAAIMDQARGHGHTPLNGPPNVVVGTVQLGEMAKKGNKEAREDLERIAGGYLRGDIGADTDWQAAMAAMVLGDVIKAEAK